MSFDVNVGRSQPIIKPASNMNNDGGSGGNTGYMMRGRKKDQDEKNNSLFSSDKLTDSFEMASKLPPNYDDMMGEGNSWINKLLKKLG